MVYGEGQYIADLKPDEQIEVTMRVSVDGSADVYATINARREDKF